jgi:hypothetical protein
VANTTANLQFASEQRLFRKRNGGMREHAVLLENLFLIRICSRDPGPHMVVKQLLVGTGGEPLAYCGLYAMAMVMVCFFGFGPCSEQSLSLF